MNPKIKTKYLLVILTLLFFSCSGELEDCYDTVCTGPDGTNCTEEPNFDSSCFPTNTSATEPQTPIKINDEY